MTAIQTARAEWEQSSLPYPQFNHLSRRWEDFRKYGEAAAWLEWQDNYFTIIKIETLKSRSGAGTRLLLFLRRLADQNGIHIHGNPLPYRPASLGATESTLTHEQLWAWYAKHGFIVATWIKAREMPIPMLWYPNLPPTL